MRVENEELSGHRSGQKPNEKVKVFCHRFVSIGAILFERAKGPFQ